MPEEYEPKIVAFFCNWCTYLAADLAGTSRIRYAPNARVVRVMCSGRVDKDFIAAIMARGNRYPVRLGPEWTAALVTWLASPDCDLTGEVFSILRGHYARVFSARGPGWAPEGLPRAEDIGANIAAIRDTSSCDIPQSGIDEGDCVTVRLDRQFGSPG
jgi:hypothetical protein